MLTILCGRSTVKGMNAMGNESTVRMNVNSDGAC